MYPISYEADPALEGRNRLTTFFRYIVAIPWLIVASIYGFVAEIAAIVAWFAIVFTGKYPQGIYDFNAGYLRICVLTQYKSHSVVTMPRTTRSVSASRPHSTSTTGSRPGCA